MTDATLSPEARAAAMSAYLSPAKVEFSISGSPDEIRLFWEDVASAAIATNSIGKKRR